MPSRTSSAWRAAIARRVARERTAIIARWRRHFQRRTDGDGRPELDRSTSARSTRRWVVAKKRCGVWLGCQRLASSNIATADGSTPPDLPFMGISSGRLVTGSDGLDRQATNQLSGHRTLGCLTKSSTDPSSQHRSGGGFNCHRIDQVSKVVVVAAVSGHDQVALEAQRSTPAGIAAMITGGRATLVVSPGCAAGGEARPVVCPTPRWLSQEASRATASRLRHGDRVHRALAMISPGRCRCE